MGVFDTIIFKKVPKDFDCLQDAIDFDDNLDFQTKDTLCFMDTFDFDGERLFKHEVERREMTEEEFAAYRKEYPIRKHTVKESIRFRARNVHYLLRELNPICHKPNLHNIKIHWRAIVNGWLPWNFKPMVEVKRELVHFNFHGKIRCYTYCHNKHTGKTAWIELQLKFTDGIYSGGTVIEFKDQDDSFLD